MIAIVTNASHSARVLQREEGAGGGDHEAARRQHGAGAEQARGVGSRRLAVRLVIDNGTRQRPAMSDEAPKPNPLEHGT